MASAIVGALRVILSADTGEFKSGLGEASAITKQFSGQLTGMTTQVASFGKVFGTLFTVGAITAAIGKVADYAGKIQDLSEKTGLTAESLQEMGYAAKQTGTALEGFTNAAFKLGTNLADGTSKVQGATEALGLSYEAIRQMAPDQQFKAIADALGKVENIQERNRLGVVLMGKGYKEVAAAVNDGYDEMANRASKSSAAQIKALADAGDKWDEFKGKVLNLGVILGASFATAMENNIRLFKEDAAFLEKYLGIVKHTQAAVENWKSIFQIAAEGPPIFGAALKKNLPAALATASLTMEEAGEKAKELDAQILASIETNKNAAKAVDEFTQSLRALGGADALAGAKNVLKQLEALDGPLNVLPSQLEGMADQLREGAEAALLMGDADLAGQYSQLADTLSPVIQFQQRFNVTIGEYVTNAPKAAEWTEELNEQLHRLGGTVMTIGPLLENKLDLSKMFEPFKGSVAQNLPKSQQWQQGWDEMKVGLSATLSSIPGTLARAFEGGGDVWGAIKSIGSQIGSAIGGGIGFALGGPAGRQIGQAIGSLVGPAMEGFKNLFGVGINDEIKKFNKEIAASQTKLIATYGSLERIDRIGKAVGVDLAAAWKSQGEAGKLHFDALAADFEEAVAKMEDELEGFQDELSDTFDDARELGYIFDKEGKLISVSFEKMQEKANEYGVDLNALGPAFNAQKIAADAGKIINAFDLLHKGGASVGTILFGMKDEISKLVQDSIKFGTTIPDNMKPWIQNLIDTGQLIDDNGEKITDIGLIKFAPAIETQFEAISRKIGDLIDKIDGLITILADRLTPALDNATRDRNIHIGITTDPIPEMPMAGMAFGGFATGTLGRLGKWFGNFPKTGFATALHGAEAVITPDQAPAFAMDVLAGLNAPQSQAGPARAAASQPIRVQSVIENRLFMDGHEMKRWILDAVTTAIENNERGIRSRQRDALGITT